MFELVDDLISMGAKAGPFPGGGEPMLYKPLPEVVERLAKGGIKVASLTNGLNLKGKMAAAFAAYGTWVCVSVDGWDVASFAKARKNKDGSFKTLLKNISNFVDTGTKCTLGVSFIVGEANAEYIFEACEKFKAVGAHHIKIFGAVVSNDVAENNIYYS